MTITVNRHQTRNYEHFTNKVVTNLSVEELEMKLKLTSPTIAFFTILMVLIPNIISANPRVTVLEVEHSIAMRGIFTRITECQDDEICSKVLAAAASYVGVPPEAIGIGAAAASALSHKSNGEIGEWWWKPSAEEAICSVRIKNISNVPGSGSRTASLHTNADVDSLYVYSWAPKRTGGRSGYSGILYITTVPDEDHAKYFKEGFCNISKKPLCQTCRGATQNDQGMDICYGEWMMNRDRHNSLLKFDQCRSR